MKKYFIPLLAAPMLLLVGCGTSNHSSSSSTDFNGDVSHALKEVDLPTSLNQCHGYDNSVVFPEVNDNILKLSSFNYTYEFFTTDTPFYEEMGLGVDATAREHSEVRTGTFYSNDCYEINSSVVNTTAEYRNEYDLNYFYCILQNEGNYNFLEERTTTPSSLSDALSIQGVASTYDEALDLYIDTLYGDLPIASDFFSGGEMGHNLYKSDDGIYYLLYQTTGEVTVPNPLFQNDDTKRISGLYQVVHLYTITPTEDTYYLTDYEMVTSFYCVNDFEFRPLDTPFVFQQEYGHATFSYETKTASSHIVNLDNVVEGVNLTLNATAGVTTTTYSTFSDVTPVYKDLYPGTSIKQAQSARITLSSDASCLLVKTPVDTSVEPFTYYGYNYVSNKDASYISLDETSTDGAFILKAGVYNVLATIDEAAEVASLTITRVFGETL